MKLGALLLSVVLGACAAAAPRLDRAAAEELVSAAIRRGKPAVNPAVRFPVREITPAEAWERMRVQIFQVEPGAQVDARETFAVRQGQVVRLGTAFGGSGVGTLLVAYPDGEGTPELTFSYTWGSGETRTDVGVLRIVDDALSVVAR